MNGRVMGEQGIEEWGGSIAVALVMLSGFDSKPIMATGDQHLPVLINTPTPTHTYSCTSTHTPPQSHCFKDVFAVKQHSYSCAFEQGKTVKHVDFKTYHFQCWVY